MTPLRFTITSPPSGGEEDFTSKLSNMHGVQQKCPAFGGAFQVLLGLGSLRTNGIAHLGAGVLVHG
jgi:hypothetical protein